MSKKIIFMGTPDFAVESLKQIVEAGIEVAAVVTSPDRPAGRGQAIQQSAVKTYALAQNLPILQPEKLKDTDFLNELGSYRADLFVVVAFRMLPELVWDMPPRVTINLHGSLLPNYRGAAPINWAVINGEKETGATTFFIEKEIDTGRIIDQVRIPIKEEDDAGSVHDELMVKGAHLLATTVNAILDGEVSSKPQSEIMDEASIKHAPKIFKPDCKLDWTQNTEELFNKIRGLSPYPTAWTQLVDENQHVKSLKIFKTRKVVDHQSHIGAIKIENNALYFGTGDGWLEILELQLEGKKRIMTHQFLLGYKMENMKLVSNEFED